MLHAPSIVLSIYYAPHERILSAEKRAFHALSLVTVKPGRFRVYAMRPVTLRLHVLIRIQNRRFGFDSCQSSELHWLYSDAKCVHAMTSNRAKWFINRWHGIAFAWNLPHLQPRRFLLHQNKLVRPSRITWVNGIVDRNRNAAGPMFEWYVGAFYIVNCICLSGEHSPGITSPHLVNECKTHSIWMRSPFAATPNTNEKKIKSPPTRHRSERNEIDRWNSVAWSDTPHPLQILLTHYTIVRITNVMAQYCVRCRAQRTEEKKNKNKMR